MAETMEVRVKLDDQASRQLKRIDDALRGLDGRMGGLKTSSVAAGTGLGNLASKAGAAKIGIAAVGVAAVAATRAILESARAYENTVNQLRLVTQGTDDYNKTIARLQALSSQNRTSFDATVELYTKLRVATEDLGYSTEQVEGLTTKLSQALAVAGADAGTANGVIRQFGQAMASGVVRGDEFNSIVEGLGPALNIMARESGITVGKLREMAGNGELTAEVFANMLLNSNALGDSFNKLAPTMDQVDQALGDSLTNLGAAIDRYFGLSDAVKAVKEQAAGLANDLATTINKAADPETLAQKYDRLASSLRELQQLEARAALGDYTATLPQPSMFDESGYGAFLNPNATKAEIQSATDALVNGQAPVKTYTQAIADLRAEMAAVQMQMFRQAEMQSRANYESALAAQNAQAEKDRIAELDAIYGKYATTRTQAAEKARELAKAQQEQNDELQKLLDSNRNAMSFENQAIASYYEKRAAIEQLNEQLKSNTTLTDRQKRQIEATITGLTREKNILHEQIKSGEMLYNLRLKSSEALTQNAVDYDILTSAVQQLLPYQNMEGGMTEQNIALMNAYTAAIAANRAERAKLLGQGMTLDTLKTQVSTAVAETQANKDLFQAYKDAGASATELAEAKRILGIASETSRASTKREQETYKEFYDNIAFNAQAHLNRIKHLQTAQNTLNALVAKGGDSLALHKKMLEEVNKGLEDITGQTGPETFKVVETLEDRLKGMVGTVSNTLTDVLLGMKDGFTALQDIALSVLRTIISTLIEAFIRQQILGQALNFGGGGSLLGGLAGLGMGTLIPGLGALIGIGALLGGGFANGGSTASAGQKPILVGERGPEIFMPGKAGTVVANEELNAMNGQGDLAVNFTINAIDTQTGVQFLLENKRVITGVIQEAYMRRGSSGPLG